MTRLSVPCLPWRRLIAGFPAAVAAALPITADAAGAAGHAPTTQERHAMAVLAARGLPVFCGGSRRREVAVTFDDGPSAFTRVLVAKLRQAAAPVTFFEIGVQASRDPAATRLENSVGVVGEHTETHTTLTQDSRLVARLEIADGRRAVARAVGAPVTLFRAPDGSRNPAVDRLVAEQGLLSIGYTVDPRDWTLHTAANVIRAVERDPRLVAGAILLLHENHLSTVEAVPAILADLRARGLTPVTIPRLLADDPPTPAEERVDLRADSCVHLFPGHALGGEAVTGRIGRHGPSLSGPGSGSHRNRAATPSARVAGVAASASPRSSTSDRKAASNAPGSTLVAQRQRDGDDTSDAASSGGTRAGAPDRRSP